MPITNATVTTGTAANIYVSSGNSVVATVYFCNVVGSDVVINLHAVPDGGSVSAGTLIYKDLLISPNDTYIMDVEKLLLSNNDTLRANSNVANSVTATASFTGA